MGAFRPRGYNPRYPDGIVDRRVVDQGPRLGFRLWGPLRPKQTRMHGFQTIVPIEYEGYRRTIGAGHLIRAGAKNVPLFVLDVAFNGYFQYQAEADLPGHLRFWRAAAGGVGNAAISGGVALGGSALIGAVCVTTGVETAGAGCVLAIGAAALFADFGLNYLFDNYGKESYLEFFGLGREKYEETD